MTKKFSHLVVLGLVMLLGVLTSRATSYVIPNSAYFPYSDEGILYKSDFPLQIKFDTIPSQPVLVSYTSNTVPRIVENDPMEVNYYTEIYNLTGTILEIPWNENVFGYNSDGFYHVDINIGFLDDKNELLTNLDPFNCLYSISPKYCHEDSQIITYYNFDIPKSSKSNTELLPTQKKIIGSSGKIIASYPDDGIPEDIKECIEYAQSIWESVLPKDVHLNIKYSLQDEIIPIEVNVSYGKVNTSDEYYIPNSLKYYLLHSNIQNDPNGLIKISSLIDWDTNHREEIRGNSFNLTSALVRSIGQVLGIGSSIQVDSSGNFSRSLKRGYTIFDSLILRSDGKKFTNINPNNSEGKKQLKDFIEGADNLFYVKRIFPDLQLMEGPYSNEFLPLSRMKYGVMTGELSPGSYYLTVDPAAIEVLRAIGWTTIEYPESIICPVDISMNGIGSASQSYQFGVNDYPTNIKDIKWSYSLPLKSGGYEIINLQTTQLAQVVSIVPILDTPDKYVTGIDGLIRGVIECTFVENGILKNAVPYLLYRWPNPKIEFVRILGKTPNTSPNFYNLQYEVSYFGGDRLQISYEVENSSAIRTQYIDSPFYYKGEILRLPKARAVDLTFTLMDTETTADPIHIHLSAEEVNTDNIGILTNIREVQLEQDIPQEWKAYNLMGIEIWRGYNLEEFKKSGIKGIFILFQDKNEQTITKIIL